MEQSSRKKSIFECGSHETDDEELIARLFAIDQVNIFLFHFARVCVKGLSFFCGHDSFSLNNQGNLGPSQSAIQPIHHSRLCAMAGPDSKWLEKAQLKYHVGVL